MKTYSYEKFLLYWKIPVLRVFPSKGLNYIKIICLYNLNGMRYML